jgi:hypothetical protein
MNAASAASRRGTNRDPKKLSARHREVMRRLVDGQRVRDIARDMAFHESTLTTIIKSPLFQKELDEMMAQVADAQIEYTARLGTYVNEALDVSVALLRDRDGSPSLRQKVSADLMNRYERIQGLAPQNNGSSVTNNLQVNNINLSQELPKGDQSLIEAIKMFTEGDSGTESEEDQDDEPSDRADGNED